MSFQSANNHLQSVSSERQAATSFFPKWQYDNAAPLSISMAAMDWPFKGKNYFMNCHITSTKQQKILRHENYGQLQSAIILKMHCFVNQFNTSVMIISVQH